MVSHIWNIAKKNPRTNPGNHQDLRLPWSYKIENKKQSATVQCKDQIWVFGNNISVLKNGKIVDSPLEYEPAVWDCYRKDKSNFRLH